MRRDTGAGLTAAAALLLAVPPTAIAVVLAGVQADGPMTAVLHASAVAALAGSALLLRDGLRGRRPAGFRVADLVLGLLGGLGALAFEALVLLTVTDTSTGLDSLGLAVGAFFAACGLALLAFLTLVFAAVRHWWPGDVRV